MDVPPINANDCFISTGLPIPWNRLEHTLHANENFSAGAQKVAEFFLTFEGKLPADDLLVTLIYSNPEQEWFERLLYCMLDIGYPDLLVAKQVLRLRCLRRLFMRFEAKRAIGGVSDLLAYAYGTRKVIEMLNRQNKDDAAQRSMLVNLIAAEEKALQARISKLSESVDVYNLKEMARVLPVIRRFDENKNSAAALAETIRYGRKLDTSCMTFADTLRCGSLDHWLAPLRRHERLRLLCEALELQSVKMTPTRSLIALTSLCRWMREARHQETSPLDWICQALSICEKDHFCVDVGDTLPVLRDAIDQSGAWIDGTVVSGSFSDKLYSQWINVDGLSRPLHKPADQQQPEPEMEVRQIVKMNVSNDALMVRLLDNSRFYATAGVVEYITLHSHSSTVLSKIASSNVLFAGSGNQGVPAALLKSQVNIPLSLLRQFLKPSYFSSTQLRVLISSAASEMRHEIFSEIQAYLGHTA